MPPPAQAHAALILVDVQPEFMPGGTLACDHGDTLVAGIDALLRQRRFRHVVATQDWHPPGHVSFASAHPGHAPFEQITLYGQPQTLWPDHCVQGTPGAALHPGVDWTALDAVIRKGSDPAVDSYSGFRENHGPRGTRPSTGLAGWLRERGVDEVFVCGLARDVCVLWTAQDARALGFRASVLWELSRPVTPDSDPATRAALQAQGIGIVVSV
ncbi:MAG: bifunctional nicotinamidase/pyrazinamidase [Pseudomonadota bacterium]|nr:bifunctional nicotinamidase/pyrazinamidase [Xanthomonadaceae bacterium]MDE3209631.1 bifunctional nicotinamidase/pyrazinamidase [Pseudomonadota bacterium]